MRAIAALCDVEPNAARAASFTCAGARLGTKPRAVLQRRDPVLPLTPDRGELGLRNDHAELSGPLRRRSLAELIERTHEAGHLQGDGRPGFFERHDLAPLQTEHMIAVLGLDRGADLSDVEHKGGVPELGHPGALAAGSEEPLPCLRSGLLGELGRDLGERIAGLETPEGGLGLAEGLGTMLLRPPSLREEEHVAHGQLHRGIGEIVSPELPVVDTLLAEREFRSGVGQECVFPCALEEGFHDLQGLAPGRRQTEGRQSGQLETAGFGEAEKLFCSEGHVADGEGWGFGGASYGRRECQRGPGSSFHGLVL